MLFSHEPFEAPHPPPFRPPPICRTPPHFLYISTHIYTHIIRLVESLFLHFSTTHRAVRPLASSKRRERRHQVRSGQRRVSLLGSPLGWRSASPCSASTCGGVLAASVLESCYWATVMCCICFPFCICDFHFTHVDVGSGCTRLETLSKSSTRNQGTSRSTSI